ncbi:Pvc16 family protein [Cereibacter sphaeroides]|uniref:Pvc16 family protein n=1 Tax=Cereibacter sphaeroides TaxID=1063 RepID=UPI001F29F88F|nr:Pvc16 family protein [Cereibacter sphaeroides]MCE6970582.1 DUF4255 domain-containing protein [Cereibacter sphaeroides]
MALPVSSLSVAIQGFADFLDTRFGEEVVISLDAPQRAQETAKNGEKSLLNIFVYRLAPSGFHAAAGSGDPLFVRAHVLLTCFPAGQGDPPADTDLRVLGHAMSVLQSFPVIPVVLPGGVPAGAPADDFRRREHVLYRIEATLQSVTMEEMNHIWTTQGGELAYRLSCGYELALIPVEPLSPREAAPPARAAVLDIAPSPVPVLAADGTLAYGAEARAFPLAGATAPPADWLPVQLFRSGEGLGSTATVPAGTATVKIALAGPLGGRAALTVAWLRAGGASETQAPQAFTIAAQRIDDPAAAVTLALQDAAGGDRATITAEPAANDGTPLPGSATGNVLTLTVGA